MVGEKRPALDARERMAARFANISMESVPDLKERQQITLAYLDVYIHDVGCALYETHTGRHFSRSHGTPLSATARYSVVTFIVLRASTIMKIKR